MPRDQRSIVATDIMPLAQYEIIRADKRSEALLRKQLTRIAVGPNATAMFETWDSMWLQIQEMLRIEKGGQEQLADELAAYDPMVPKGSELTCTLLFEIGEGQDRQVTLLFERAKTYEDIRLVADSKAAARVALGRKRST